MEGYFQPRQAVGVEKVKSFFQAHPSWSAAPGCSMCTNKQAIQPNGYWVPGELAKTAPDKSFAYSWFPVSSARKGRKIQAIGNHNAIIPTAAQHRDEGWRLSEFLVSNEAIKIIFDGTGFLAPTREFLASPDSVVNTKQYKGLDFYISSVKEADELLGWPPCPIEPFAWDQWQKAIDAVAYPIAASLYYSFTDYDLLRPPVFVGLANYADLAQDELIGRVLHNTLYFVLLGVPAGVVVAFLLATLLNQPMRFRALFRTIFFVPSIVPAVAAAMIWLWIYNTQYGVISSVLRGVGMQAVPFLSNQYLAKPSLILIHCWASGAAMLIFLAALQDVPPTLYEAAKVDGAGAWRRFLNVTVPMCTPAILSDAARVDGCSELGILVRIIAPLSLPALAVVGLFEFMYVWNDFLAPLIYLRTEEKYTVALGLTRYQAGGYSDANWAWLMAASVTTLAPILVLFFFAQRTFVQGISLTGVKG